LFIAVKIRIIILRKILYYKLLIIFQRLFFYWCYFISNKNPWQLKLASERTRDKLIQRAQIAKRCLRSLWRLSLWQEYIII